MPILDQLQKDLVAAMKAKEEARLSAIRMIKTALQKAHADTAKALDDAAEQQILKSLVKQRIDAADMFRKGGREELAAEGRRREEDHRELSAGGRQRRRNAGRDRRGDRRNRRDVAKQMGLVMKAVQAKLAGKTVDGKWISEKVKAKLA